MGVGETDESRGADLETWLTPLLLLVPGYLALRVMHLLGDSAVATNELDLTLSSVVLSLAGLFLAASLRKLSWMVWDHGRAPEFLQVSRPLMLSCVLSSVLIGALMGAAIEKEWALELSRAIGLTPKVSSLGPIEHVLVMNGRGRVLDRRVYPSAQAWLKVTTSAGTVVSGYQAKVARAGDSPEIYLSPACFEAGEVRPVCGPGILVTKDQVALIELVDEQQSKCRMAFSTLPTERCPGLAGATMGVAIEPSP